MISIVFIGVATALVAFAIMAKLRSGEPKRAKKAEKAEIIKQLLALSEQENSTSRTASSARFRALPSGQGVRPGDAPRTTAAKTSRLSVQQK